MRAPVVTVRFRDAQSGDTYPHRLGAWEIKEAYSVAVAELHGGAPKLLGKAYFEYLAVRTTLAHFVNAVTPLQVIALCHWALQDLAPGNTLFALLRALVRPDRTLPPAADIYDAGRQDALQRGLAQNCRDVLAELQQQAAAFRAQGNGLVATLFEWYHDHAGRLLLLHLDPQRRFPLDTFLCADSTGLPDADRSRGLASLFHEVHLPLLFWPDGSAHVVTADARTAEVAFFNRCVVDLLSKVWWGTKATWRCPIYGGCALPLKDPDTCKTRPWRKGDVLPTCSYGAAAQVMGLGPGKELVHTPIPSPPNMKPLWFLVGVAAVAAGVWWLSR